MDTNWKGKWDHPFSLAGPLSSLYKKVVACGKKNHVTWQTIAATAFMQKQSFGSGRRRVWQFDLYGVDAQNTPWRLYKYEGNTSGSGQTWIYINNKKAGKLSDFLPSDAVIKSIPAPTVKIDQETAHLMFLMTYSNGNHTKNEDGSYDVEKLDIPAKPKYSSPALRNVSEMTIRSSAPRMPAKILKKLLIYDQAPNLEQVDISVADVEIRGKLQDQKSPILPKSLFIRSHEPQPLNLSTIPNLLKTPNLKLDAYVSNISSLANANLANDCILCIMIQEIFDAANINLNGEFIEEFTDGTFYIDNEHTTKLQNLLNRPLELYDYMASQPDLEEYLPKS